MSFAQKLFVAILLAVIVSIFPFPPLLHALSPQFVLLIFIYLQLYEKAYFYIALLFFVGIILDILHANILGQHSLAMALTCLLMVNRSRRFHFFPNAQQVIIVFCLVLFNNTIFALTNGLFYGHMDWRSGLLSAVSSALCWSLLRLFLGYHPHHAYRSV